MGDVRGFPRQSAATAATKKQKRSWNFYAVHRTSEAFLGSLPQQPQQKNKNDPGISMLCIGRPRLSSAVRRNSRNKKTKTSLGRPMHSIEIPGSFLFFCCG